MGVVNASYPGARAIKSVRVTVGHDGWAVALMRLVPQPNLPSVNGNLTLFDGFRTVTLYGCRIDRANIHFSGNGHVEVVQLLGRTWKWKFGTIDGTYNVRRIDGTIEPDTEKSPQELAYLAFRAMGEPRPDVGALPNDPEDRPFVNWECEDARQALFWLCNRSGCSFGLDVRRNRGAVWRLGAGLPLPNNADVQSVGFGVDLSEFPDAIRVCTGPVLVQSKLKLENVMRDTDLSFKKADDVSYNPGGEGVAGGWDGAPPFDPIGDDEDVLKQHLAAEDYCRKWRPVSQADGSLDVPGYEKQVPNMEHLRPIFDTLAESYENEDGVHQRKPAYLEGTIAISGEPDSGANTGDNEVIEVPFRIDSDSGIVDTGKIPLTKFNDDGEEVAADVYLVCSYYVLDPDKYNVEIFSKTRRIGNNNAGTHAVKRPDIQLRLIAEYDDTNKTEVKSVADNANDVNRAVDAQIRATMEEFRPSASHAVRYRNLQYISADGAIRQVTWLVQCSEPGRKGGAWTMAYRNTESEPGIPLRRERLRGFAADQVHSNREYDAVLRRRLRRKGLI